jgi:hypothetical protein
MAFSSTKLDTNLNGKYQEFYFDVNFASVTVGYIKTGLRNIIFADHLNNTTENDGKLVINKASDGSTAEQGGLYMTGFTSNDTARIRVIGN